MEKNIVDFDKFLYNYNSILNEIQNNLLEKNKKFLEDNTVSVNDFNELESIFKEKNYFVSINKDNWKNEKLEKIMDKLSLSYRCLPFNMENKLIIARSY